MKTLADIRVSQASYVSGLIVEAERFLRGVDIEQIQTALLSGSVARGDFFPGELGGMIDLTIMRRRDCSATAEELFGRNEEPDIPFHCVRRGDARFQIEFADLLDPEGFRALDEARKYALLESRALYDPEGRFTELLRDVEESSASDREARLGECLGYIGYLLSDYKKDRWMRREAYIQLHENLSAAVGAAVRCLFYVNGSYCPAEDRRLYYSHSLERLPGDYAGVVAELKRQDSGSREDYERREALFRRELLGFIEAERARIAGGLRRVAAK